MVRALPIGAQDFKEIRESDYLYVVKSDMISQILSDGAEAYQFTRPRRFGKSLNLSMLDAFFNLKYPKDPARITYPPEDDGIIHRQMHQRTLLVQYPLVN